MSISMERFASHGHFATYDPFGREDRGAAIFQLQCRSCGYEADNAVSAPGVCPKCHSESWERFVRPGSILENASRY